MSGHSKWHSIKHKKAAIDSKQLDTKDVIDEDKLVSSGVLSRKKSGVKLLGGGALKSKVSLKITKASKAAQQAVDSSAKTETARTQTDSSKETLAKKISTVPVMEIQHLRPADQRGLNVFETPKTDTVPYTGFKLAWGAAFTQQFQGLQHSNTAAVRNDAAGVNQNKLMPIANGFNNAVANLYLDGQLAHGIRVSMTSYLSARHHNEAWVKDGYLLVDASPIDFAPLNVLMRYVTVKAGHFEVNYGDGHFRRTDNGNALYNPFVGNYVMDAFTTEVGGEVYVHDGWWQVMGGVTNGEVRGMILNPGARAPAFLGKAGIDKQFTPDLRVRLMG